MKLSIQTTLWGGQIKLVNGATLPAGATLQNGGKAADGTTIAAGTVYPAGATLPAGTLLYTGAQFGAGAVLNAGVTFVSGLDVKKVITIPRETEFPPGTLLYGSYDPQATTQLQLPPGIVLPNGTQEIDIAGNAVRTYDNLANPWYNQYVIPSNRNTLSSLGSQEFNQYLQDASRRKAVEYVLQCIMTEQQSVTIKWLTDWSNKGSVNTTTVSGIVGLAPNYNSTGVLNESEQRWASACLYARVNQQGQTVVFDMRAPNMPQLSGADPLYPVAEATLFGNMFADPPTLYACTHFSMNPSDGELARFCNDPSSPSCAPFDYRGACSDICTTTVEGNQSCKGPDGIAYTEVINTYLACPPGGKCCTQQGSTGVNNTCFRKTDGTAWCWGQNGYGQLGNGTTTSSATATQVKLNATTNLTGVTAISAGQWHVCARTADSKVYCWGRNGSKQVGQADTSITYKYAQLVTTDGTTPFLARRVHAFGVSTCAVKEEDGSVYCWGDGVNGQLGNGGYDNMQYPVQVRTSASGSSFLNNVIQISGGLAHVCALRQTGGVYRAWCWGANESGQLGDQTQVTRAWASMVTGADGQPLPSVRELQVGSWATCARKSDRTVQCWGANVNGELGNGTTTASLVPVNVMDSQGSVITNATSLGGGLNHSCVRLGTGAVRCWGMNGYGQLGDGTTTSRSLAVLATVTGGASLQNVRGIQSGSGYHTCVRQLDGTPWCWGKNSNGQAGAGASNLLVSQENTAILCQ